MKFPRLLFPILLLALALCAAPRAARAEDEAVSFDYFYDNLSPYGEWVEVADYGLCWRPNDVNDEWAPYTDGYWAYTDAGWTWVSYEDFGSIVYHYGRWIRVDGEGWCWVPDSDWGPAWVSWRDSDEYVGWAPLPPEARFEVNVGFSTWVDDTYDIGPDSYRFCHVRDFGSPVIREVCLPRSRNIVFIGETVNITNITINTGYGVPFCGGPRYDTYSRRVERPIPALKLVQERNITNINIRTGDRRRAVASVQRGNTLVMPAPRMRPITDRRAPLPSIRPSKVFTADRVNRGWGTDRQQQEQMRSVVRQQTKGATPKTAPARAFTVADTKEVPQKADPKAPIAAGRGRDNSRGPAATPDGGRTPAVVPRPAVAGDRKDRDNQKDDDRRTPPTPNPARVDRPDRTMPADRDNPPDKDNDRREMPGTNRPDNDGQPGRAPAVVPRPDRTLPADRDNRPDTLPPKNNPAKEVDRTPSVVPRAPAQPFRGETDRPGTTTIPRRSGDDSPRTAPTMPRMDTAPTTRPANPVQPTQPTRPDTNPRGGNGAGFRSGRADENDNEPRRGQVAEQPRQRDADAAAENRARAMAQQREAAAAEQRQAAARQRDNAVNENRERASQAAAAQERAAAQANQQRAAQAAARERSAGAADARERAIQAQQQQAAAAQRQAAAAAQQRGNPSATARDGGDPRDPRDPKAKRDKKEKD